MKLIKLFESKILFKRINFSKQFNSLGLKELPELQHIAYQDCMNLIEQDKLQSAIEKYKYLKQELSEPSEYKFITQSQFYLLVDSLIKKIYQSKISGLGELLESLLDDLEYKNIIRIHYVMKYYLEVEKDCITCIRLFKFLILKENECNLLIPNCYSPNKYTFSTIIQCYIKLDRLDQAEYVICTMKKRNLKIGLKIYTQLMAAYAKIKEHKKVMEYFNIIKTEQFPLDQYVYSILIYSFGNQFQLQMCIELYEQIGSKQRPNNFLMTNFIRSLSINNQNKLVVKYFNEFVQRYKPSSILVSILFEYFVVNKYVEQANLIHAYITKNQLWDSYMILTMMKSYSKGHSGFIQSMELIQSHLKLVDAEIITNFYRNYSQFIDFDTCIELVNQVYVNSILSKKSNLFNIMLMAALNQTSIKEQGVRLAVIEKLIRKEELSPNILTFIILIDSLTNSNCFSKISDLIQKYFDFSSYHFADENTQIWALLDALSQDEVPQDCLMTSIDKKTLVERFRRKCRINPFTTQKTADILIFNLFLFQYVKNKDYKTIKNYFQSIESLVVTPNLKTFLIALNCSNLNLHFLNQFVLPRIKFVHSKDVDKILHQFIIKVSNIFFLPIELNFSISIEEIESLQIVEITQIVQKIHIRFTEKEIRTRDSNYKELINQYLIILEYYKQLNSSPSTSSVSLMINHSLIMFKDLEFSGIRLIENKVRRNWPELMEIDYQLIDHLRNYLKYFFNTLEKILK